MGNNPLTTNLISLMISYFFRLSNEAGKIKFEKKRKVNFYLMQVSLHLNYQFPHYGFDFTDA